MTTVDSAIVTEVVAKMKAKPVMVRELYRATIGAMTAKYNLSNAEFDILVRFVECYVPFSIPTGDSV